MVGPETKGYLLVVPVGVVVVVVINLVIKTGGANGLRGEIQSELLEGPVVHIIVVGGTTAQIHESVVPSCDLVRLLLFVCCGLLFFVVLIVVVMVVGVSCLFSFACFLLFVVCCLLLVVICLLFLTC